MQTQINTDKNVTLSPGLLARIEEEVVVTETGCEVISLFPAEELPIANRY